VRLYYTRTPSTCQTRAFPCNAPRLRKLTPSAGGEGKG